jgi:hypothetical protein
LSFDKKSKVAPVEPAENTVSAQVAARSIL